MMWKTCESDFNLSRHLIPFLQDNAFYCELSRHIHKEFTNDISTGGVTFDKESDELVLFVNPTFLQGGDWVDPHDPKKRVHHMEALTDSEIRGFIEHELSHIVFGHLYARARLPPGRWNFATDCAINSLIEKYATAPHNLAPGQVFRTLPACGLIPGKRPQIDPEIFSTLPKWKQDATLEFADLIEHFAVELSSENYFNQLCKVSTNTKSKKIKKKGEKGKCSPGKGGPDEDGEPGDDGEPGPGDEGDEGGCGGGDNDGDWIVIPSMDDHEGWKEVDDDSREYVEGKCKAIIEKAVRNADRQKNGWGSIPHEIRDLIRKSVSNIVDWRAVLRQFVGSTVRGTRTTSIKRINRRYPYVHPGVKRGYVAKLAVAVDMSGSVDDEMLEMFFGELASLTRKVDVSVLPFDCSCEEKDIFEWRKGAHPKLTRVKCGGTNFNAPTELVNSAKNRGRWDGFCILTDGMAPKPVASRVRRGWVIGEGCKLNFESNELQVFLNKSVPMVGAWR